MTPLDKWKEITSATSTLIGSKGPLRTDIHKAVPICDSEDTMKEYRRILAREKFL